MEWLSQYPDPCGGFKLPKLSAEIISFFWFWYYLDFLKGFLKPGMNYMSDNILGQTELEQMIIEKNVDLVSKARTPIDNQINIKGLYNIC